MFYWNLGITKRQNQYLTLKFGNSTVYYVGVRKDGAVLGINDPDGVMLQIVNFLIQDV